jgi:hypothetical protein
VEPWNLKSFTRKTEDKLWEDGTKAYMTRGLRYKCPFYPFKPRDGQRESLLMHVKALAKESS